jgi:hypothetical protein
MNQNKSCRMTLCFANYSPAQWPGVLALVLATAMISTGYAQGDLRFGLASEVQRAVGGIVGPSGLGPGDFDGDGKPDFVFTRQYRDWTISGSLVDWITVALGAGDGTFHSLSNYLVGGPEIGFWVNPILVATADINRDGLTDVLVPHGFGWGKNGIAVFTATNGGALFRQADITITTEGYCSSLAFGDFNGDSHIDFVIKCGLTNQAILHYGDGRGGFPARTNVPMPEFTRRLVAADVNLDGRPDLLAGLSEYFFPESGEMRDPGVAILLNRPSSTFVQGTNIFFRDPEFHAEPGIIQVADFNGDGWPDFAASADDSSELTIVLQRAGVFTVFTNYMLAAETFHCAVADFNGDGIPDLVTDAHYLVGKGNGEFIPSAPWELDERSRNLAVADVNRDGRPDILRTLSSINCLTNDTRPRLRIERAANQTRVSWPAWLGFTLKAAPDLHPNTTWTVVNEGVTQANGRNVVVQPVESLARFFRLEGN